MTATNHALTGAIVGLSISNPYLAIPLAFLSHFALDALPHFDYANIKRVLPTNRFLRNLVIDVSLCVLLVVSLFFSNSVNWLLASICAFVATSPDLAWAADFFRARKGRRQKKHQGLLVAFHAKVQWFQRPIGAFVEIAWLISCIYVIAFLTR